jgi:striatin 1/3/4
MEIQEKFHLSEDKVIKFFKHANKGPSKSQQDRLLAGDFDPNQVKNIYILGTKMNLPNEE